MKGDVFASTTLDYRFNSGKYTKFSSGVKGGEWGEGSSPPEFSI